MQGVHDDGEDDDDNDREWREDWGAHFFQVSVFLSLLSLS